MLSDSGLENREHDRRNPSRWPSGNLYPQKLALTSMTSCGRSVGIVYSRTQATEFSLVIWLFVCMYVSRAVPRQLVALLTAEALVRALIQTAYGQVLLRVLRYPLPSIPPIAPHSSSSIIILGWYNRPVVATVIVDSVPLHPKKEKNVCMFVYVYVCLYVCIAIATFKGKMESLLCLQNSFQFVLCKSSLIKNYKVVFAPN
jgi:hypothetical protein